MAITPSKPIFCATHPRACSTAFERSRARLGATTHEPYNIPAVNEAAADIYIAQVFMTRRDKLACVHEPFGDAFYYGPERVGERFEDDAEGREKSGFSKTTYADVLKQIEEAGKDVCVSPARSTPILHSITCPSL
ncbi:hypothetical protein CTA2_307 [Colletotrichum tanaceti]|uniref:Uncharacterized protein n=1 Tax=Colletotrichum tanaceti TaxID=1306861 RepID=A0A4U6X0N0_9PEZI|nr:hypothetical protein CTA2_307 [Colletotrichum tanaceti]TKW48289.1 hypothetical protein CTA1_4945 [Colletotrichum tanaceti]